MPASWPASSTRPAGEQGAHDAVDVDAAHRRDPGPRDRLLVGHHRERLERGLGQPGLLALEHEALHRGRVGLAGVVAPPAGHVAQLEAAVLLVVLLGERLQRADDVLDGVPDRAWPGSRSRAAGRRPSAPPPAPGAARQRASRVVRAAGRSGGRSREALRVGGVAGRRAGGAPSNSSVTSASASVSSSPVQRSVSTPSGVTWSKTTTPSRNSSSSERKRATVVRVSGESRHSAAKVVVPARRSRSTTIAACSRTETRAAWMCCSETSTTGLGAIALAASAANCSRPIPMRTSGSSAAKRSSSPTARG